MAADRINVDRRKGPGNALCRIADLLTEMRALAKDVGEIIDHTAADPDYTGVESAFGVPTGSGQATTGLVGVMRDWFDPTKEVSAQARVEQYDEVIGRLGRQSITQ